jgi:tetratricopeptide (TPR) repeat protein
MDLMKTVIESKVKDEAERLILMGQLAYIGYTEMAPLFHHFLGASRSDKTEVEDIVLECANLLGQDFATDAIKDFSMSVSLDPDNAEAFYLRGSCHAMTGDIDKALADYEQALALNPDNPKVTEKRAELLEILNEK